MTDFLEDLASPPPGSQAEQQLATILGVRHEASMARCKTMLRRAKLRPTRQRVILGRLLFSRGNRHVMAEMLHEEAMAAGPPVALATVYNSLNQFAEAGLLRQIGIDGARSVFDTNPSEHHHFFIQDEDALLDIPSSQAQLCSLPQPPEGYEIARVDVVVRLRRRRG